jgi:hypothetical protein
MSLYPLTKLFTIFDLGDRIYCRGSLIIKIKMAKIRSNNIIFVLGGVMIIYFYFFSTPLLASLDSYERNSVMEATLVKAEAKQGGDEADFEQNQSVREASLKKDRLSITKQENDLRHLVGSKQIELGCETSNIVYRESNVMRENGLMYGISGSFIYYGWIPLLPFNYYAWLPALPEDRNKSNSIVKLEGKLSTGQVDYRNSGTIDDIRDYMLEARVLVGPVFYNKKIATIPYLGWGYRYLNDDSGGKISSTGAYGYERESNYYYMPIGVNLITDFNHGWFIETNTEFDIFLGGRQISHLSDVVPELNDLTNNQENGYGLRGSLKIRKGFETVDFIIEPFIKYWNIKESEKSNIAYNNVVIGYGYEPRNDSTEYGIKLAMQF